MLNPALKVSCIILSLNFYYHTMSYRYYYEAHFVDEEMVAQRLNNLPKNLVRER